MSVDFKPFIQHCLQNNLETILSRSLLNCHCRGLHSIVLKENQGDTIRLFITEEDCELYMNLPEHSGRFGRNMSLSFHPHHCNLTLHCVKGSITNWTIRKPKKTQDDHLHAFWITEWEYTSQITHGRIGFDSLGTVPMLEDKLTVLNEGDHIAMHASEIHTVGSKVPSAWFVYEGKEDPNYKATCFSNAPLDRFSNKGLYSKMDIEVVEKLLSMAGLL